MIKPGDFLCLQGGHHRPGSFGVRVSNTDGDRVVLSSAHVVGTCNVARRDRTDAHSAIVRERDPVTQVAAPPAAADVTYLGQVVASDPDVTEPSGAAIGTDSAVVLIGDAEVSNRFTDAFGDARRIRNAALDWMSSPPSDLVDVWKMGASSGYTRGMLEADPTTVRARLGTLRVRYPNLFPIQSYGDRPFAVPGDSGLVVCDEKTGAIVGLLVVAEWPESPYATKHPETQMSYCVPIRDVLREHDELLIPVVVE